MRNQISFLEHWKFMKQDVGKDHIRQILDSGEPVILPHTWNALDGQDGGNDYYRGTCWYARSFKVDCSEDEDVWIEFSGVAMRASIYVNGQLAGQHDGGYSTFRIRVTDYLKAENVIAVAVDNAKNNQVYPQKADFTFYGGIYRNVSMIRLPKAHFALNNHGGPGLMVTPKIQGNSALVHTEVYTENVREQTRARLCIWDTAGRPVVERELEIKDNQGCTVFEIKAVHLWNGKQDPYQYTMTAELLDESGNTVIDRVETKFGCRTFRVDPEEGFFLNGRRYPLCGAARHQDRLGVGNALTKEMHAEDMQIMLEMGANTIRAAHYQHDTYFYDLADQYGMIVWAEIPYMTEHLPEANDNVVSQMRELIVQNYNHPSIICWSLSNEITASDGINRDLTKLHQKLNELCHKLDPTRLTVMAHVFMLDTKEEALVRLPDICSYNLYYGWYVGEMTDNDQWFDRYHREYPLSCIGLSEYGADANPQYQSEVPEKGDYTEGYQALYHEHMLKMWSERPYIWAMYVWNMFDFGADGREEGGKPGQNQKGLVTFDRKIKKDAFYIYKAYLSDEPFIHLCGKRYIDRTGNRTEIKVYSNQSEVTLFVDGEMINSQVGDKIFRFDIPVTREHQISVRSGELNDTMVIRHVTEKNPDYICPGRDVVNWFDREDMEIRPGYYSIKDSVNEIKKVSEAARLYMELMAEVTKSYGEVAANIRIPEEIQKQMDAAPLEVLLKQAGSAVTEDMVVTLNKKLNRIQKKVGENV